MEVQLFNQDSPLRIDNSKKIFFNTCPKKYYWTYIRGMHSVKGSTPLRYGVVWHAAMEAFYGAVKESGWKSTDIIEKAVLAAKKEWEEYTGDLLFYDDYRTMENLMLSLVQFINHYAGDEGMIEIINPETKFKLEMTPEVENERGIALFFFTGKIDLEVMLNSRLWIIDHKTTGQALSIQAKRLQKSQQFMGYDYATKRKSGEKPDGALIMLHHLSAYKSKKTLTYGKPKILFDRIPLVFNEFDIMDWRASFMDTVRRIQWCTERNFWPKQHDNCFQYGLCQYSFLCDQHRKEGEEVLEDHFYVDTPWDVLED